MIHALYSFRPKSPIQSVLNNGLQKGEVVQTGFTNMHEPKFGVVYLSEFSREKEPTCLSVCLVLFSHSVMSLSLRPHGLQHARLPCPSPTPRAYSNSCPLSQWCHPSISSSVIPLSSCCQSFPASGAFPVSQVFSSGGQSTGVSVSASVLPVNIQYWFPLGWTGWISLQSKGLSIVFSNTAIQKHEFFSTQLSLYSKPYIHTWLLEKS